MKTDYSKLFYWLTVADNAKTLFIVFIIIFTLVSAISTFAYITMGFAESNNKNQENENMESQRMARKWMWCSYPFMILFWSLYVFTPDKRDALLIVAGGQTMNFLVNDESAKQIPKELSSFVLTELKNMASDAKVDLGISNQKEKVLDEAKNMTTKELLDRIKVDSTFAKIVLDKK